MHNPWTSSVVPKAGKISKSTAAFMFHGSRNSWIYLMAFPTGQTREHTVCREGRLQRHGATPSECNEMRGFPEPPRLLGRECASRTEATPLPQR